MISTKGMFKKLRREALSKSLCEANASESTNPDVVIHASGGRGVALGWDAFAVPTGICSEPYSDELKQAVQKDEFRNLMNNPIYNCVFYSKDNHFCFFAGECKNKLPVEDQLVSEYRNKMKDQIDRMRKEKEDI